jgi:hypothetical protein
MVVEQCCVYVLCMLIEGDDEETLERKVVYV